MNLLKPLEDILLKREDDQLKPSIYAHRIFNFFSKYSACSDLTKRALMLLVTVCFISMYASANEGKLAGTNEVTQYEQTIGDTRIVLLAISSVHNRDLTSQTSLNDATNLDITYMFQHLGTNSSGSPAVGAVRIYLKNKENNESPMNFNGAEDSVGPRVDHAKLLGFTCRTLLKNTHYTPNARVDCVIECGVNGQSKEFKFKDIRLP